MAIKKTLFFVDRRLDGRFSSVKDAMTALARSPWSVSVDTVNGLDEISAGKYKAMPSSKRLPASFSLKDRMPPVYDQSNRGTCAANAATALMEYYVGGTRRLSVQYLFERAKREELETYRTAAEELSKGCVPSDLDMAQEAISSIGRKDENGNVITREQVVHDFSKRTVEMEGGSTAKFMFSVLEKYGICSYDAWPYTRRQLDHLNAVKDFAERIVPPGADADAKHYRLNDEYYIFPSPNNVEEIKGYLSGSGRYKPMPIYIGATVFSDGAAAVPLENGVVTMPKVVAANICSIECEVDHVVSPDGENRWRIRSENQSTVKCVTQFPMADQECYGGHAMLLVGYEDDESIPGGGSFIVRNSWGENWGDDGYARMPYAYVELFVREAATILVPKDENDVAPDTADRAGSAQTYFASNRPQDEWTPYAVRAPMDMKNRKGLKNILKGDRILMNADEGIADLDTFENRVIFKRQGFRWIPSAASVAAPVATPAAEGGVSASMPGGGTSTETRFFMNLELALKSALPDFPCLGGIRPSRLFRRSVGVERYEKPVDLTSRMGRPMKVYSICGRNVKFRVAAVHLGHCADAASLAEKARQTFAEYNASQRFDPCQCSIMLVAADGDVASDVPPYVANDDVRIVFDRYAQETGWRISSAPKANDDNWTKWVVALSPNSADQAQNACMDAWRKIDALGGHVTLERMSAEIGIRPEVIAAIVADKVAALRVKGDRVVKA